MELDSAYRLNDQVRLLQRANYALIAHLGNGAWFKIVPWATEVLANLSARPLGEVIQGVSQTYELQQHDILRFFETLARSEMIETAAGLAPSPNGRGVGQELTGVIWRAGQKGAADNRFSGQAAVDFVDTLVMSQVQRLILEGDWPARQDISDILSLAHMVSGFVLLAAPDTALTPEACERLESIPELVEVLATGMGSAEDDPLEPTRAALSNLKESFFNAMRVRAPLADVKEIGLEAIFAVLDSLEVGLDMSYLLPSERDPLCMAGELGEAGVEPAEILQLFKQYLAHEISIFNVAALQWFFDRMLKRAKRRCGAGRCFVVAEADGGVYPCLALVAAELKIGDWAEGMTLEDIAADSSVLKTLQARDVDDIPGCRECDVRYFCGGGCPANALRAGDILGQDPLCPVYQTLFRTAIDVWQDDRVLEKNFAALVNAL